MKYTVRLMLLFLAKVLDNGLSTAKTILIQRNQCLLAGIAMALSSYLYFTVVKDVVSTDSTLAVVVVSIASGLGCCLAVMIGNHFSREKTFIHVVMSDQKEAVQDFRDYLARHHITNVASDSYTRDWNRKTITVTAYPETKHESQMIEAYLSQTKQKFKRVVY